MNKKIAFYTLLSINIHSFLLPMEDQGLSKLLANTHLQDSQATVHEPLDSCVNREKKTLAKRITDASTQTEPIRSPKVFFSPGIKEVILQLITQEQASIHGAYYRFTLYDLAQALCAKHTANVPVSLVVDKEFADDSCAALRLMAEQNIPISRNTQRHANSNGFETMHHKFLIFGCNRYENKKLLCSGSFNATGQANKNNWENITIIDDPEQIEAFEKELSRLWQYSKRIAVAELSCKKTKSQFSRNMNNIPDGVPN